MVRYAYDAAGNRIQSVTTDNSNPSAPTTQTQNYLVDTNFPYAEVIEEYDGQGQLQALNTFTPDRAGDLLSVTRSGEGTYYAGEDGHGSLRQLTDAGGVVKGSETTTAWGEIISSFSLVRNTVITSYGYGGESYSDESGVLFLRKRDYVASVGRFMQCDVFSGFEYNPLSMNKYIYANSSPVSNVDPAGTMSLAETVTAEDISTTLRFVVNNRIMPLMKAYDKVQTIVDFLSFASVVKDIFGAGADIRPTNASEQDAMSRTAVNFAVTQELLKSASFNLPATVGVGIESGNWVKGYEAAVARGTKLKSIIIYAPLIAGIPIQAVINTPASVRLGNLKVPIRLAIGSPIGSASGSIVGYGVEQGPLRQLARLDFHFPDPRHGGIDGVRGNEIAVWADGSFHYHVLKW